MGRLIGCAPPITEQLLALEVSGLSAALYVGSWSGWIADGTRPVATGP